MNKQGFTLTEVLTVVLIIGVLTSIALPKYMRSVERARATEAMSAIKAINDATYAYFTDKESCANLSFSKLSVTIPEGVASTACTPSATVACTKNFKFTLKGASAYIPGTDEQCLGVLATRINGGSYNYTIWNPYTRGTTGKALALQCAPTSETDEKSIAVCESLGLYREPEQGQED